MNDLTIILDYKKGFGGKFGIQSDRQDKTAVGYDHQQQLAKHESQSSARGLNKRKSFEMYCFC